MGLANITVIVFIIATIHHATSNEKEARKVGLLIPEKIIGGVIDIVHNHKNKPGSSSQMTFQQQGSYQNYAPQQGYQYPNQWNNQYQNQYQNQYGNSQGQYNYQNGNYQGNYQGTQGTYPVNNGPAASGQGQITQGYPQQGNNNNIQNQGQNQQGQYTYPQNQGNYVNQNQQVGQYQNQNQNQMQQGSGQYVIQNQNQNQQGSGQYQNQNQVQQASGQYVNQNGQYNQQTGTANQNQGQYNQQSGTTNQNQGQYNQQSGTTNQNQGQYNQPGTTNQLQQTGQYVHNNQGSYQGSQSSGVSSGFQVSGSHQTGGPGPTCVCQAWTKPQADEYDQTHQSNHGNQTTKAEDKKERFLY